MLSLLNASRFARILAVFALIGIGFSFSGMGKESQPARAAHYRHPSNFFEAETFAAAIDRVLRSDKEYPSRISGGVVPHHLVPGFVIADFFKNLSHGKPDTIILIGPNHYERGRKPVLSSSAPWQTPFGDVQVDLDSLDLLISESAVSLNDEVLSLEHSMGNIMPFIKYYLPESKVVPLILSKDLKESELKLLLRKLQPLLDAGYPLVASVDFSHYQTRLEAEKNDTYTESLILEGATEKLLSLGSEYIDSPPSIVLLLLHMHNLGKKVDFLYHTNSGVILGRGDREITTYFSWAF